MNYAVIKTGGKQYKVTAGEILDVERLNLTNNSIEFTEVLMSVTDGTVAVGNPFIPGAIVKASVVGNKRGVKIRVSKFKAKARQRRVIGHRQELTTIKIDEIINQNTKSKSTDDIKLTTPKSIKKSKKITA